MRFILIFLLSFLPAIAQNKTWGGTSTSLFPNLAPNAVVFSTSGTNGLTVINGNVPTAKIKFAAPIGTPSTNDNLLIRSNDGYVHISTYTVGDLLSIAGTGQNIANSSLTATGNHVQNWDGNWLVFTNLSVLDFHGTGGQTLSDSSSITIKSTGPQIQITPSKVELKAIGSNKINFFTDAIQQGTATVGQIPVLSNTSTGGWEWGNGATPSSGNVITVDTVSDLLSEFTPVVITQGYYSVGDGGHAAYRYVSGDLTATNTVTVFEGAAGRYFLMQSGSISAKQAGAVGDGVTDDHDALQAGITASEGLTFRIDPISYYSSAGFDLPDDIKIIARGASLAIDLNGETGVAMGSRCTVDGGSWVFTDLGGESNGFDGSGFTFGNYVSAGSVSNSVVKNVSGNLSGHASSFVFITGASENITIDTVEFGDSADVDDVVTIHWGYVSGSESNGTLHPHNITVRNINAGLLTSGSSDASPIFCSAAYNVLAENIHTKQARHGAIMVVGDFGFKYAGFTAQTLGSVVYRNLTCLKASNLGLLIQGVGTSSVVYPQEFVIENSTLFGPNNGTDTSGLYFNTSRNATIRNSIIAGFVQGTVFTGGCKNTLLDASTFTTNRLSGVQIDNSTTVDTTIRNCKFYNNGRLASGSASAGVELITGINCRIIDCAFGNVSGTEPNQEVGVKVGSSWVSATVTGNYCYGVKSGGVGVAYNLGGGTTGQIAFVANNQAAAGVTLYDSAVVSDFGGVGFANFQSSVNAQTGTTYTVVARDTGKVITASNGSAITITVNTDLPDGGSINIMQLGAGQITISPSGLTLRNRSGFTKTAGQYSVITLIRIGTDLWLTGDGA